ncbi:MAG TPA: hypothetical protein G4N92_02285 [Anaerolineae bacterium]|nr:hypothetical protein [Anaerolineae bacterium]
MANVAVIEPPSPLPMPQTGIQSLTHEAPSFMKTAKVSPAGKYNVSISTEALFLTPVMRKVGKSSGSQEELDEDEELLELLDTAVLL